MQLRRLLKETRNAIIVGLALYAVFAVIYYLQGQPIRWGMGAFMELLRHLLFSYIVYMANALVFYWMFKKYNFQIFTFRRLLLGISANVLVSMLAIFVGRFIIQVILEGSAPGEFLAGETFQYYTVSLTIALVVSLIFYLFFYYKRNQEFKVKEQKIIAGTASAKFDALKNQLDPHFLFNSLNVLTSLIEEDPHQAQKFTTSLSKVYRYVLEQKNKELVHVDEELRFAHTYIKLLKMRFEDSIIFDIPEKSSNSEAKIIPLSLQLLLENAVKHNVVTESRPLKIRVVEQQGMLWVENNLQEKNVMHKTSGVGLQNIRQRFSLLTDRAVHIQKDEKFFRVGLPILTRQLQQLPAQDQFIEEKRYKKAQERVKNIKEFYTHAIVYCLVIPFLWWLNYRTTSFLWAIFPTLGWGFGMVMHGMEAFGYNPLWGKHWEEKKIRELMDKEDF
jgi:hypothetical protein